jgi:hypothetical protein
LHRVFIFSRNLHRVSEERRVERTESDAVRRVRSTDDGGYADDK